MRYSASSGNTTAHAKKSSTKTPPVFYTGYSNRMSQLTGTTSTNEKLTPMERKILKKLKESARGKTSV